MTEFVPDTLPAGGFDLHVHSGPDLKERICDDIGLAEACRATGLRGALIKSHSEPTGSRAWLARRAVAGTQMFGGLVLNRAAGGLNPAAVEALATGTGGCGRLVWLPTRDAEHEIAVKRQSNPTVPVTEAGRPVAAFHPVAEAIARHDLVLASGHVAPEEALACFAAAREAGCRRLLVTHATAPVSDYSTDQLDRAADLGAVIELCARNFFAAPAGGRREIDPERIARAYKVIRRFGPDRVLLSSDLGDTTFPPPLDGLARAVRALEGCGLTTAGIEALLRDTPRNLIGA